MGYARGATRAPHTEFGAEDKIHTWRGARYTTNTTTGCVTVQVGPVQTPCAGTCLYVQEAFVLV